MPFIIGLAKVVALVFGFSLVARWLRKSVTEPVEEFKKEVKGYRERYGGAISAWMSNSTPETIFKTLQPAIAERLNISIERVTPQARFREDLHATAEETTAIVALVWRVLYPSGSLFYIPNIPEWQARKFVAVSDIVDWLGRRKQPGYLT